MQRANKLGAKHGGGAKELADMSQALALRRAATFGEVRESRRIPADATELWVPKDWTPIAQLPPSRLVPGKPLGTTKSFHAAIVDRARGVRAGSASVEVDGIEYVRRRTAKRAGATVGLGVGVYIILRGVHGTRPAPCKNETEGDDPPVINDSRSRRCDHTDQLRESNHEER